MRNEAMAVTTMSQPQRSHRSRKLALGLGAAVVLELVVGLVAFSAGRTWLGSNPGQLPSPLSAVTSRMAPAEDHLLQTGSGSSGPLRISAALTRTEQWMGGFRFAGPGQSYTLVHVLLRNAGVAPLEYQTDEFSLVDRDQRVFPVDAPGMRAMDGTLTPQMLGPGERAGGYLVFRLPASAQGLSLVYQAGDPTARAATVRITAE
jgi:hypothetical protein